MCNKFGTHGAFSWCELHTTDAEGAKKFYKELLGWEMEDMPMMGGTYTVLKAGDEEIGGIMTMPTQAPHETVPHWGAYVTVDDVDATALNAERLGGNILVPPTDIPEVGRFCVFQDLHGATLAAITYANPPE